MNKRGERILFLAMAALFAIGVLILAVTEPIPGVG